MGSLICGDRNEEAVAEFTKAIDLDPMEPASHDNRRLTYYYQSEYDKVIADFYRALDIKPKYAPAHLGRARVFSAKRDYDRAVDDYDRAWADVHKARSLGMDVEGEFVDHLRKTSGRDS